MAITTDPEEALKRRFALERQARGARREAGKEQLLTDIQRRAALAPQTGASEKARRKALIDLERGFSAEESEAGAQEAGALAGLSESERGRQFAREERLGSEAFAGKESALAREQQGAQFTRAQDFAEKFGWAELEENKKTNLFEKILRMKEAGIVSKEEAGAKLRRSGQGLGGPGFNVFSADPFKRAKDAGFRGF